MAVSSVTATHKKFRRRERPQGDNFMAKKKKYSYNDRVNYHHGRIVSFVDRFRGKNNSLDIDALESAEKRHPNMQYSDGFSTFASDIGRGYIVPADELKKEPAAYQRGYKAAKAAYEKSRNIKF